MLRLLLLTFFCGVAILAGGIRYSDGFATHKVAAQPMSPKSIEQSLKAHTNALMAIFGVVGVGQSLLDNAPCIKVFVVEKTPELQRQIPKMLDGHPVVVEETGGIKALPRDRIP